MPTVKYKGGMKKFPYNAVGKAQAAFICKNDEGQKER